MSVNRTIGVLLKDLGLKGDVDAITECLTEYFHDEQGLLEHQPSEEQLVRMGITLEVDRKKVLGLIAQNAKGKEKVEPEKVVGLPGATAKQYELDLDGDAIAGFLPLKYYLEGEKDEERSLSQISQLYAERRELIDAVFRELRVNGSAELPALIAKLDNKFEFLSKPNRIGVSALYYAACTNAADAMVTLISTVGEKCFDFDFQAFEHKATALHVAAAFGFFRVCAVLLYFGASTTAVNANRKTARDEARVGGEVLNVFEVYAKKGKSGLLREFPKLLGKLGDRKPLLRSLSKGKIAHATTKSPSQSQLQPVVLASTPHTSQPERQAIQLHANSGGSEPATAKEQQQLQATASSGGLSTNASGTSASLNRSGNVSAMSAGMATNGLNDRSANSSAMTAGTRERDREREKEAQLSPPSSNHNNNATSATASSSSSTPQPAPSPRLSTMQKHQVPPTPLASQPSQLILFHAAGGVSDLATQGLDSNPALAATVNDSQFTVELCGFLTAAARNNNVDSMRQLLHSIDEELTMALCAFSPDGETPLIAAAKRGHLHIVQQLVSHKDVAAFIDLQAPPHSSTALHFACQNAHPDVCALLLIAGASSVSKNDKGLTCRSESKDDGIQFLFSIYDKFGIHGLKMTYFPSDEDLKTAAKSRRKSIGKEAKSVFSNATAMATSKSSSSTSGSAIPFGASGKAAGNFLHCAVSPTCVYTARGKEVRAPALMATPSSSTLMSNVLASTSALSQAVSGPESAQGPCNPLDVFEAERILSCVVVAHSSTKLKEFLNLLNYGTSTYCMIEQTLIRLIPFSTSSLFHTAALTNSFCAKSILNEPDLAIYLSQPQMEVSEMLKVVRAHKEFKKLPYLAVDMDGRKDTKGEALASLGQNYLGFEKAQSRTMRQELMVSRLSPMLWQGKRRVGVAIPPYFYTFWRSYSQDLRLTTRANVMAALHEAVFANSVKADAKSAVLLSTTAIYTVYFPDSRLKKSLNVAQITEKGLTAQTMTVKDLLVIVFKLQAADLDNSIIMSVNKTKIALTDSIECVAKSQFMLCILPNLSEQAIQKAIEKFGWVVVSDGTVTSDEDYVEVNVFTEFIKFLAGLKPQTEASTNLTLTYEKIMEFCATIHGAKAGTVFRALRNFGYFYLNKYASVYVVPSLVMNQPERTQLLLDFENSKRERKFNRYFLFSDRPYSGYFAQIYAGLNTTFSKLLSYCWISNSNTTMSFILYKLNDNSSLLITLDAHLIFVNYSGISNDQLFFFQVTHAIRLLAKNINPSLIAEELVACSECLKNANASAANNNNSSNNGDHLLFLSELFQFNRPGKNATAFYVCEHTQATLSLDALVPDFEVPVTTFDNRPMKTLKKIGQGAFGVVTRCELEDGSSVAVKSFRLDQADGPCAMSFEVFQLFQREALLASRLSSDYILRQMGIIQREYCLVQEFAPHGVLGDVLYSDQALPIRLRNKFCQDIALGLKYLHGLKPAIIHRDLRSYNIFVMSLELPASTTGGGARPVNAKIGDFGLSVQSTLVPLREPLESWQWLAPEIISGSNYTEQSDIYSFGIIAYEIYSRVLPFTNVSSILHTIKMPVGHMGEEEMEALRAAGYEIEDSQAVKVEFKTLDAKEFIVKEGLRPLVTGQYFEEGSELVKLLEHCWQTSPHGRPTAPDLCELVETLPDVEPSQKFLWRTTKGVSLTNYRKIGRSGKSQKQLEVQLLEQGRRATRVLAEDDAFLEFQRRQSSYRKPTPSQPSLTLERVADDAATGTGGGESKSSERTGKKYRRAGRALDPSDDDQAMRKSGEGELSSDGLSLEYSGGEAQTDSSGALHSSTGSALSVGGSPNRSEHVPSGEEESKWARLIPLLPTLPTIPVPNQAGSGQPSPNERAKDQEEAKLQQFIQAYTQRRMTVQNLLIPHSTDGDSASHSPSSSSNNSNAAKERRYDLASGGLAASQGKSLKERKRDKALSTSRSNNDVTATRAREASEAGNGGEALTHKSKSPKRANADEQPQEKLEKARSRRKSKSPNRGLNSNSHLVESLSTGNLLSVGDGSECVEKENRPDRDRSREEQREREKERRSSANAKLFVQAKRTKSSSRGGEERESRVELGQRSDKARSVHGEAAGDLSAHVQSDRGNSRGSLVSSLQHLPTTANNSLARLNAKDPLKASDDMAIVMSPKINPASLSLSSGSSTSDKSVTSLARQSSHERNFQRRCSSPAFSGAMSARGSKPNSADASSTALLLDSGANSQSASSTASSSSNAEATTTTKNTLPNSSQKKEPKETATFLQTSVSERAGLRTMPPMHRRPGSGRMEAGYVIGKKANEG